METGEVYVKEVKYNGWAHKVDFFSKTNRKGALKTNTKHI